MPDKAIRIVQTINAIIVTLGILIGGVYGIYNFTRSEIDNSESPIVSTMTDRFGRLDKDVAEIKLDIKELRKEVEELKVNMAVVKVSTVRP